MSFDKLRPFDKLRTNGMVGGAEPRNQFPTPFVPSLSKPPHSRPRTVRAEPVEATLPPPQNRSC